MVEYAHGVDRLLAVSPECSWGALQFDHDPLSIVRGGAIGSKPWTIPFSVPLILAPNAVFYRTDLLYVLIDASGPTIDDFVVLRVGDLVHKRFKIGELRRRVPDFLDKLLALVRRQDQRLVYYEWFRVNPFNATGTTYIEDASLLTTSQYSDEEISSYIRMIQTQLPHSIAEHPDLCPPHPNNGYILYKDLLDLDTRREEEDVLLSTLDESAFASPKETKSSGLPLFETKFIGNVPKGATDVTVLPEDDLLRKRAKEYNFDALIQRWSTESLRQFLHLFKNHVFRGDFRIPRLHTIFMKRTIPGGLEAMCCMFEEGEMTLWVDPAKLKSTRGVIEGMISANPKGVNRAELDRAMAVVQHNDQVIQDFIVGTGRPPSPNQWTQAEEERSISEQKIMTMSTAKRDTKLDSMRVERERVEKAAREKAASIACQQFQSKTIEELDAETDRIAKQMLDGESCYISLVHQIKRAEQKFPHQS